VSNYEKTRLKCDDMRLFEYAMIVTLQDGDVGLQPRVLFCFPHEVIPFSFLAFQIHTQVLYVSVIISSFFI